MKNIENNKYKKIGIISLTIGAIVFYNWFSNRNFEKLEQKIEAAGGFYLTVALQTKILSSPKVNAMDVHQKQLFYYNIIFGGKNMSETDFNGLELERLRSLSFYQDILMPKDNLINFVFQDKKIKERTIANIEEKTGLNYQDNRTSSTDFNGLKNLEEIDFLKDCETSKVIEVSLCKNIFENFEKIRREYCNSSKKKEISKEIWDKKFESLSNKEVEHLGLSMYCFV